jgi:phenylacetate-CoA ligase
MNEKIRLRASDRIKGFKISEYFPFLMESQFWSAEQLKCFQEERLRKLVGHLYHNVPFYNNWFKTNGFDPSNINILDDLRVLPILTKDDIRKNDNLFRASNLPMQRFIRMNSSGSTGEPFKYLISNDAYSMKYAAAIRGWYWMGYRLGDYYAKLSQNTRSSLFKKLQDMFNSCLYIYIPDLSLPTLREVIKTIENKKPEFVRCYPDPLFFMARILQMDNRYIHGIKAINTTGNILTDEARKTIEERFSCPVYDSYSAEGSAIFSQSPERLHYLGSSEYAITEILDNNGNEVKPGETGFHVTTDLWNLSMPLIRYNTQDMVVKTKVIDGRERQLTALDRIIGRENDILVTPSGNMLIVHLFTIYFEYFDSIRQFQIEQISYNEFIFRLVVSDGFSFETERQIADYWKKSIGDGTKLTIEIHDEIPLLKSGKRRFLIRAPGISLPL